MAVLNVITADLDTNCGYARINDASVYSATPDSRADYGKLIFVSHGGAVDYSLSDFTNSDPWYVPIVNHTTYTVECFQVDVWKLANAPYAAHSIVYDNTTGLFWYNNTMAATNHVPGVGADWIQVTNDAAGYLITQLNAPNFAVITVNQDCPDYTLSKVECVDDATCCMTWRICDNSGNATVKQVALFTYTGTFVSYIELDPADGLCVDITVAEQGTYIVGIRDKPVLDTAIGHTIISNYTSFLVIYEYCQLMHCARYLIDQILCSNDPCAEICNPCDATSILRQQNARTELNRLFAMFATLMGMIHAERIKYLDYYSYDTTRADFVTKIGAYMIKVLEVSIRCGICTSSSVAASDNAVFQQVITTSTSRTTGCTECGN